MEVLDLQWQKMVLACIIMSSLRVESQKTTFRPDCYIIADTALSCSQDLPDHIPVGVKEVYITDYNKASFAQRKHVFKHHSWKSISKLDIIVNLNLKQYRINNYDFSELENLAILGVHTPKLRMIKPYGFAGLNKLTHLDLSDCLSLGSSSIVTPLTVNKSTPSLKSIDLKGLQTHRRHLFNLSRDFLEMLQTKAIKQLSLSGTNVLLGDYSFFDAQYKIEYLDLTNITLLDISSHWSGKEAKLKRRYQKALIQNVKTINASGFKPRFQSGEVYFENKNVRAKQCDCWPANLETLDMSYSSIFYGMLINNATADLTHCPGKFKTIISRGNNLDKLNATLHWPENASITELDFSSNKISYISPNFLNQQKSLRYFHLSNNSLYGMEQLPEFSKLLQTFDQLELFDMAYNSLTTIPRDMFSNNPRIKVINLKGNKLRSVTFYLMHLSLLKELNLESNNIINIDGRDLHELQQFYQLRTENKSSSFIVDLRGNPLECACSTHNFIKWIERTSRQSTEKRPCCKLNGDCVDIDKKVVEKSTNLCHRTLIIVTVSVSCFVATVSITLIISTVMKVSMRKKGNIDKNSFLQDLKTKKQRESKLLIPSIKA